MFNTSNNKALKTPSIILSIALFSSFVIVGANLYSIIKGRDISQRWQYLTNDILEASYYLSKVERNFGYGGFIHHFKNLVLRRNPDYMGLAEYKLIETENNFNKLKGLVALEGNVEDLQKIEIVIKNYRTKFYIIKNNPSYLEQDSTYIDKQVKVDDTLALVSLAKIIEEIETTRLVHKNELDIIYNDLVGSTQYLLMAIFAASLSFAGLIFMYIKTKRFSKQFEDLFNHSPNALFEINSQGEIIKLNKKAQQMFGYSERELLGQKIEKLIPPSYMDKHIENRKKYIIDPGKYRNMAKPRPVFGLNSEGKEFPVEITLSFMQTESDDYITIADIIDVTDKHQFKIQSQYDHLTRLFNRRAFEEKLQQELAPPVDDSMALMILDIDHFKKVNDDYGHITGDHVLMKFSDTIHRVARKNDVLCRWGGEEFVILLPNMIKEQLLSTCERFREGVEETMFEDVNTITCSIGATMLQEDDDIQTIIQRADIALYQAKDNGRNQSYVN